MNNLLKKGVLDLDNKGQFDLSDDMVNVFVVLTRLGKITHNQLVKSRNLNIVLFSFKIKS